MPTDARFVPRLTPEVQTKMVAVVRAGHPIKTAARAAGVGRTSVYRWLAWGRQGIEPYATCARALWEAEAVAQAEYGVYWCRRGVPSSEPSEPPTPRRKRKSRAKPHGECVGEAPPPQTAEAVVKPEAIIKAFPAPAPIVDGASLHPADLVSTLEKGIRECERLERWLQTPGLSAEQRQTLRAAAAAQLSAYDRIIARLIPQPAAAIPSERASEGTCPASLPPRHDGTGGAPREKDF